MPGAPPLGSYSIAMPECKRCRAVFLEGETHDCRDFRDGQRRAADSLIVWYAGGAILMLGMSLFGMASFSVSVPGVLVFLGLIAWRRRVGARR